MKMYFFKKRENIVFAVCRSFLTDLCVDYNLVRYLFSSLPFLDDVSILIQIYVVIC